MNATTLDYMKRWKNIDKGDHRGWKQKRSTHSQMTARSAVQQLDAAMKRLRKTVAAGDPRSRSRGPYFSTVQHIFKDRVDTWPFGVQSVLAFALQQLLLARHSRSNTEFGMLRTKVLQTGILSLERLSTPYCFASVLLLLLHFVLHVFVLEPHVTVESAASMCPSECFGTASMQTE